MITITGWLLYDDGNVFLTFENPQQDDFENSFMAACGDPYEGGDKRTYLKKISIINPSFWDQFSEDELDTLIDDEEAISFEIGVLEGAIQESNSEDTENVIKNDKQIVSKQKTEAFDSSLPSLI